MTLWARNRLAQAEARHEEAVATSVRQWDALERERLKGLRTRLSALLHEQEVQRRRAAAARERARSKAGVSAAMAKVAASKAAAGEATRAALRSQRLNGGALPQGPRGDQKR